MADLYTSLVRAKQELNGGVLPAMTPVPENVRHLIDPTYVPGLGALEERPGDGCLRCPVRGCGRYFSRLALHLDYYHGDIGGREGIMRALQIPATTPLVSQQTSESLRTRMYALRASGKMATGGISQRARTRSHVSRRRGRPTSTTGWRNLRNTCEAQLIQRLLTVTQKIGRAPTFREARTIDQQMANAGRKLWGTWNAFLAAADLRMEHGRVDQRWRKDRLLRAFAVWRERHGSLPTEAQIVRPRKLPLMPTRAVVLKAYQAKTWEEAMARVSNALRIRDDLGYDVEEAA